MSGFCSGPESEEGYSAGSQAGNWWYLENGPNALSSPIQQEPLPQELQQSTDSSGPPGNAPPQALGEPSIIQMPWEATEEPTGRSDEYEESEHYNPPPERNLQYVEGNVPVPTTQGNIGDSFGNATEPPNAIWTGRHVSSTIARIALLHA